MLTAAAVTTRLSERTISCFAGSTLLMVASTMAACAAVAKKTAAVAAANENMH